jgi:hypothetical protein
VLFQLPLAGVAARLGLREDPGAAALHLDLGEAGTAAEGVVGEPPGQARLVPGGAGVVLGMGDRRPQVQGVDQATAHDVASGSRAAVTPGA